MSAGAVPAVVYPSPSRNEDRAMWHRNRIRPTLFIFVLLTIGLSGCLDRNGPIAVLSSPAITGPAPLQVSFDLSYSTVPHDRPIEYQLDFGDGTGPAIGTDLNVVVHHTYEVSGVYTATLTVTDNTGAQATDRLTITVSGEGPPVGLNVGETAPAFTAQTTGGEDVSLSDFRGKVVLLDFWGAWCPPCRRSMPHLNALVAAYGPQGLVAIVVSTDPSKQDAIDFLTDRGYTGFISVWEPGGKSGSRIAQLYGVSSSNVGIPRTFLIDRQGVIRYVGHPLDLPEKTIEGLL